MIELVDVTKTYGQTGHGGVSVLNGITLKIEAGQSVVVVGPSGCGKSTLLNVIGGLDHPSSGRVLFDGRDLAELSETELAHIRNREVGFVFQLHHLLPQCTVLENVLVPTLAERDHLPSRQKACFVLFAVEELPQEEIADILGLSIGGVKSNIHHAKRKLRALLSDDSIEE